MPEHYPKLDPWYVTGLVDGEGCFSLALNTENRKRKNGTISSYTYWVTAWVTAFHVSLRADDSEIIFKLKEFFGCGSAKVFISPSERKRNGMGTAALHIASRKDLLSKIIPHFDEYRLQAKKYAIYRLWCEAVFILVKSDSRRPTKFSRQQITSGEELRLREIKEFMAYAQTAGHRRIALEALDKKTGKIISISSIKPE